VRPVNTGLGPVTILAFAPPHAAAAAAAAAARRAQHRRRRRRHRRRDPSSRAPIHRARSPSSSPRRDRPPARVGGVIARRPRDDVQFRARAERRTTARATPRRAARRRPPRSRGTYSRAREPRACTPTSRASRREATIADDVERPWNGRAARREDMAYLTSHDPYRAPPPLKKDRSRASNGRGEGPGPWEGLRRES